MRAENEKETWKMDKKYFRYLIWQIIRNFLCIYKHCLWEILLIKESSAKWNLSGVFLSRWKGLLFSLATLHQSHIVPLVFTLNLNENRLRNGRHLSALSLVAAAGPRQNTTTLLPECRRVFAGEVLILAIADGQVLLTNRFVFFSSSPRRQILIQEDSIVLRFFTCFSYRASVRMEKVSRTKRDWRV
jgi:hypothetical protein